jgi:DNA-binding CsgD family transcriptional regulator
MRDLTVASKNGFKPDREPGPTAPELASRISPEGYGELYLEAHGYGVEASAALQQISGPRVARLREKAHHTLLSHNKGTKAKAIVTAIDTGFLPDPAKHPDEGAPTASVRGKNLEIFQLICQGATNAEIGAVFGVRPQGLQHNFLDLYQKLNAHNRVQAVWRGYQAGLLKPSVPEMTSPSQYTDHLHSLESKLGNRIVSLPRSETDRAERKQQGYQRFEKFILNLLDAPDFAVYHPQLATYIKKRHGYEAFHWQGMISRLGAYGITELQQYPDAHAAHGIELNTERLLANQHRQFVTDRVLETYQRRLNGERAEPAKLDTAHLGFTLSDPEDAALKPVLRTAIGVTHPVMEETIFVSRGDLLRTLSTFTGQTAIELNGSVGALRQHGGIRFYGNDSHVSQKLTAKGRHLLKLGIMGVKKAA